MDNETDNAKSNQAPEAMTIEEFNDMNDQIATGLDTIINAIAPKQIRYVIAVYHEELEQLGVVANTSEEMVLDMAQAVVEQAKARLTIAVKKENKIILPH